jgi:hypothetical protein
MGEIITGFDALIRIDRIKSPSFRLLYITSSLYTTTS